ncbi:hypothetical protein OG625_40500 (plasmid) [Streptomyces sp. NBC_01351]|uniref:hypothetical protein n=1 Tax=Streptomyces sp. NBC_01351 TaxID=2903833 RepID=UPI002E35D2F3|nr:hypothetical protein [Streptomyces sp. NBC_01351]
MTSISAGARITTHLTAPGRSARRGLVIQNLDVLPDNALVADWCIIAPSADTAAPSAGRLGA